MPSVLMVPISAPIYLPATRLTIVRIFSAVVVFFECTGHITPHDHFPRTHVIFPRNIPQRTCPGPSPNRNVTLNHNRHSTVTTQTLKSDPNSGPNHNRKLQPIALNPKRDGRPKLYFSGAHMSGGQTSRGGMAGVQKPSSPSLPIADT